MGSTKIAWCVLMIYLTGNCRSKRDILFPQAIVLPTCLMVVVITLLEKYPSHFNQPMLCCTIHYHYLPYKLLIDNMCWLIDSTTPHLGTAPDCHHAHVYTSNESYIGIDRLILLFVYPSLMQCARMLFPNTVFLAVQITQSLFLPPCRYNHHFICLFLGRIFYNISPLTIQFNNLVVISNHVGMMADADKCNAFADKCIIHMRFSIGIHGTGSFIKS